MRKCVQPGKPLTHAVWPRVEHFEIDEHTPLEAVDELASLWRYSTPIR